MQIATFTPGLQLTRREAEIAGIIEPRQSGREWQDGYLVRQMRDELIERHASLDDPASIEAALRAAKFGEPAIERLAERAAQAAQERRA
jgi:hypothetical protein